MTHEFKPLVPATLKGKATFSISNNRINRVTTSSTGTPTANVASTHDTKPGRGSEVARRGNEVVQPRQLQPIVPRMTPNKASASGSSQKVILNTSGSAKFLLVNTSQMKPPAKRGAASQVSHVSIKRPNNKPYQPILPYAPPHRPVEQLNTSVLPSRTQPVPTLPKQPVSSAIDGGIYPRPKKPCNCTKSMCLKLYCDCFANGEFCSGCNCQNCHNNIQHESERSRSIKTCLERNPLAFHPKIGKTFQGSEGASDARHHSKGCHCKRSGCLKNYCECYEAKIPCSSLCKCVGCKNYSQTHSTLQELADVAVVRHQQQSSVSAKFSSQLQNMSHSAPDLAPLDDMNLDCLSMNLAAATCRCLLSAGSHAVDHYFSMETIEKAIIEEFGQCLNKIIEKGMQKPPIKTEPPPTGKK